MNLKLFYEKFFPKFGLPFINLDTSVAKIMSEFVQNIGFSVCHQLPSRTLHFGKIFLPVCSRCSGVYLGFFISAIILFLIFRKKESDLPPPWALSVLILFILSTVIDGAFSYFSSQGSHNFSRFTTGFLCGSSIMAIIYPVFSYELFIEPQDKKIFGRVRDFLLYLLFIFSFISVFIALVSTQMDILGYLFYYLIGFSILFTFYFINLMLVLFIPFFSRKASKLFTRYLLIPSGLSLLLASIEIFILFKFHHFLAGLR